MFAGAWGLLTACAPYILAAAILVIIAIKMAKRNQIGDFILILGLLASQTEPDICCARVIGDEKMEDIQTLKEGFITETNKNYDFIYALTFKNEQIARSMDISNETPVIIPEEAAITINAGLSSLEYMDF
jgi:catabolite regulation protein CreA